MITLLTEWYVDKVPARQAEYVECLERNAANPYIKEIRLFGLQEDLDRAPALAKAIKVVQPSRITFARYFEYAATQLPPEAICAVSNADIYFDATLGRLDEVSLDEGWLISLSRWDLLEDGQKALKPYRTGWDTWIWKNPLRLDEADFFQGVRRCDTRLLQIFHEKKIKVVNPALDVHAWHLHLSQIRNYWDLPWVPGQNRALLWPSDLSCLPAKRT